MPIINALLALGCKVTIASDGRALRLLEAEYPELDFIELNSYDITYQAKGSFVRSMVVQFPKILSNIRKEHSLLQELIPKYKIDAVISDNRYGFYTSLSPSVFVSHQLAIKMPDGLRCLESSVHRVNHWFINKYDQCWIPDFPDEHSLSGDLATGFAEEGFRYIGPLSRFSPKQEQGFDFDLCSVLSGPEPQRSILEQRLTEQLLDSGLEALIVRGVTESAKEQEIRPGLRLIDHLTSRALEACMQRSKAVIARSGYSTIMDLTVMQKRAILIPTPGQTEQEYLARRLSEKSYFVYQDQAGFDLPSAMQGLQNTKPPKLPANDLLMVVVQGWLENEVEKR